MKKLFFFPLLLLFIFAACNDDEDMTTDPNASPVESCCAIDAQSETVAGRNIYVPNVFTPDADGINDLFFPFVTGEGGEISNFRIDDTDGNTVHQRTNYVPFNLDNAWDGTFNGNTLAGVFDYVVTVRIDTEELTVRGQVCSLPCFQNADPYESFSAVDNCRFATQHNGMGAADTSLESFEEFECVE